MHCLINIISHVVVYLYLFVFLMIIRLCQSSLIMPTGERKQPLFQLIQLRIPEIPNKLFFGYCKWKGDYSCLSCWVLTSLVYQIVRLKHFNEKPWGLSRCDYWGFSKAGISKDNSDWNTNGNLQKGRESVHNRSPAF